MFSNFFGQKLNFRGYVSWRFFSKVSLRWSCLHYQWLYIDLSYMTACFVRIPLTMSYQCTDVMPRMLMPHCIVLRPRYCLDRVTPSRVNVLQLKDCTWNCQMNWAIAGVSRKLLIMISFDRTEKFSIVTKKRKHFEPHAFCYFTKNASTSVVDYGTILHRGRKIQVVIISVPIDILLHLKWFFSRCAEVLRSYRSKKLAEKKNPKSSYIFFSCNVQLQHKNFVVLLFWTSTIPN